MAFISVILEFLARFNLDVNPHWARAKSQNLLSREVVDRCGDNCR